MPSLSTTFLDDFVMNKEIAMLPRFESRQGIVSISIADSTVAEFWVEMSSVMEHVDALPRESSDRPKPSTWGLGDYEARRIPIGKSKSMLSPDDSQTLTPQRRGSISKMETPLFLRDRSLSYLEMRTIRSVKALWATTVPMDLEGGVVWAACHTGYILTCFTSSRSGTRLGRLCDLIWKD